MLTPMERVLHLKKIPLFVDLGGRELAAIASVATEETVPEGEVIIREGEIGETMFFVLRGGVSVIKSMDTPNSLHLADIMVDDFFGEMSLFDRQPRSASVVAKQETDLLVLNRFEFDELMREYPRIAIQACRVFSQRLRDLQEKIQAESPQADRSGLPEQADQ
jgi:CRP/FNR family cyclic AMP-dependent transcriptional regulator